MPNFFDNYQDGVFNVVNTLMGYAASWTPIGGSPAQSCRVLFRKPTEKEMVMSSVGYTDVNYIMEYKEGDMVGLFESSRAGNLETVTVNDLNYLVLHVVATVDGKTYEAKLEKV
jgi:hypothetical protein